MNLNNFKKCSVIMLPTEDVTPLFKWGDNLYADCLNQSKVNTQASHQHLYIVSNDNIEKGDWCINSMLTKDHPDYMKIFQYEDSQYAGTLKIMATTDKLIDWESPYDPRSGTGGKTYYLPQIPQSFIQNLCSKKGIDEVLIKVKWFNERCSLCGFSKESGECINRKDCPKLYFDGKAKPVVDSNNFVQIVSYTDRLFNLYEVISLLKNISSYSVTHNRVVKDQELINYIEENIRL